MVFPSMKLVKAIIKPFKMQEVRGALTDLGIEGMSVIDVRGFGRQKGHKEIYRGSEYEMSFVPKTMIEIAVPDEALDSVVKTLQKAAATGQIGDGKIFVLPLEGVTRVRTSERDAEAL
jgi:nitrogen regulatory protein PII